MKLLQIDTSILGINSVSRQVTAAIVEKLRKITPSLEVQIRDLATSPLPHLLLSNLPSDHPILAGQGGNSSSAELQKDQAISQAVLEEFLAADIVVIGAPMYNFTVPTQLKTWIDRILTPGKTFRYSETGVEGLAGGKRVIVAITRGGYYGPGTPSASAEHVESYLRSVFGFIGIANPEMIVAEGIQIGADQRTKAIEQALNAVTNLLPV